MKAISAIMNKAYLNSVQKIKNNSLLYITIQLCFIPDGFIFISIADFDLEQCN